MILPIDVIKVETKDIEELCFWNYKANRFKALLESLKDLPDDEKYHKAKMIIVKNYIESSMQMHKLNLYIRQKYLSPKHTYKTFLPDLENEVLFIYPPKGEDTLYAEI